MRERKKSVTFFIDTTVEEVTLGNINIRSNIRGNINVTLWLNLDSIKRDTFVPLKIQAWTLFLLESRIPLQISLLGLFSGIIVVY